ncbi:MAG: hypothetical protein ATN35_02835 [Epulopiscium sp. Nele67-Bin004]|nr:MAG: hypothetical protein ATN35_02835 [Epulopiscium sp. Nele67-Bin004]
MSFIDFHCDTASLIYETDDNLYQNTFHIDITKMEKANYLAQWFAFFIHLKQVETAGTTAFELYNNMYNYFVNQVKCNSDKIEIVRTYNEYEKVKNSGKLSAFLSIEEGEVVAGGLDKVDKVEEMGIRLMTLTWNFSNSLGHPHTINKGLKPYGKEVVDYLNSKKILVDVAHLSVEGIDDVLKISTKPVVASHSNARGKKLHSRNLTDLHIKKIANSGGIIGVNFYNNFINDKKVTKVADIVAMADYIYKVGGSDVVALGTDFDGIDCKLEIKNCSEMTILQNALVKQFGTELAEKFMYKNAERLIQENL